MTSLPLVTENHPERGLDFMAKGFEKVEGSWLRADRLCAMPVSFPDPRKPLAGRGLHAQKRQHYVSFLPSATGENRIKKITQRDRHMQP